MMDIIDTSLVVEYNLLDTTAIDDATCTTESSKEFADVDKLKYGTEYDGYATLEHNFFVLDGSLKEFPKKPDVSFFSDTMSDENGLFDTPPTLTVLFTEKHSSVGLTFDFADTYPLQCDVSWFDIKGALIKNNVYHITGSHYVLPENIEEYSKIVIKFTKAVPRRFVKLNKLQFGQLVIWDESYIESGTLVEDVSPISDKVGINTLKFSIVDLLSQLNIGDANGLHNFIQSNQRISPYEIVRDEKIFLGDYYVSSFAETQGKVTFNCEDIVGHLDTADFYLGEMYNGKLAGEVIEQILQLANITDYEIDAETYNQPLYGTLKTQTCRNALQAVLFATNSIVDSARSNVLHIYKMPKIQVQDLNRDVKISTTATKSTYYSGVTIKYNEYEKKGADKPSKVATGSYSAGDNLITFTSPYYGLTATDGEIIASGAYYCILRLAYDAEVQIDGYGYTSTSASITHSVEKVDAGEVPNIKSYTNTLVNAKTGKELAEKILDYLQNRISLKIQYLADTQQVGTWHIVQNSNSSYNDYVAFMSNISTDLTNGFVATGTLAGYRKEVEIYYFTGDELYSGGYESAII